MMKAINTSLLQQLKISELESDFRKALLELVPYDEQLLKACHPFIEQEVDKIVTEFYIIQTQVDEINLLIGDLDTLDRLKMAQTEYILSLFCGCYNLEYINDRLRIGMVHKRIGVEPKLYLSATMCLKKIIVTYLRKHISDPERLDATIKALDKLIMFDTTLVIDTYISGLISEIELSRDKAEQYAESLEAKVAERTLQLEKMSRRDGLTDLYNRRSLNELLTREVALAKRSSQPVSLIYFDVDKFKALNDKQGHQAGDALLAGIADALRATVRETDLPCRFGGDEFCIILPNCDLQKAEQLCQRLINHMQEHGLKPTISIGIAQSGPDLHLSAEHLLQQADTLMYQSKQHEGFQISTSLQHK